ncbi:fungal zn(2)-Cys(6) binuclear cluster domain-containing protein [Hirsutella rhossiliensis]|uniref:Fungal zn(2)-Cys(6) binuclear cluster domain-containing protein n=1 Tax=Hirsutella rhossiliensis TaxID=111463 RepID=A0A9P8SJH6_9HYPO|nr:fungal zn(2)-Cys(6) binuclear cluster domain-containing protein [Hirsutella rhossiliensis]KAH0963725.1 fungal zn(2)-Cys(6) binuclear cluster domain-containing protein [Hirsutella rhossiliensis]
METAPTQTPSGGFARAKGRRVSRACLSCRVRKTRCDLDSDGVSGNPPCRRCVEHQIECVLAKSRRGGRRVKGVKGALPPSSTSSQRAISSHGPGDDAIADYRAQQADPDVRQGWPSPQSAQNWRGESSVESSQDTAEESRRDSDGLEGHIASTDLLNPSDALDLLAQVADLDPGGRRSSSGRDAAKSRNAPGSGDGAAPSTACFPPVANGILTWPEASYLVRRYHDKYHPFFPIAYSSIFDGRPVSEWADKEPHLLTAILTVASKDDPSWSRVYEACSQYMESLVSKLIYAGSTNIGSVEALLILAEWAPQRPQDNSTIGCGQEDHGAWMLVGIAIRLGYLQRLEQTGLVSENGAQSADASRKRIAWAACYMSDRQVSIRLGKGFWSRGPIPSISWRAADFPSLQNQALGPDSLALLFQAQLELIQLFSNAHDILYSSSTHRKQLYTGGEYIRYIDDFASVLRKWKLSWANCTFTPPVKASLVLSFEFLRLYINAFAFQATLNRAVARAGQRTSVKAQAIGSLFSDVAGNPDARFIYESIDAANSLLSILNTFIDPVAGLKCMPLKYCLYVIYAAVFLFKARLAGAISGEGDGGVRRAIQGTITQLQKTSNNPHSLGRRYATSLRLLWRKSPSKHSAKASSRTESAREPPTPAQGAPSRPEAMPAGEKAMEMDPLNGFSWRDLDSLGQYIVNSSALSTTDGMLTSHEFDWEHSSAGLDDLAMRPQLDAMWSGHDIIF